MNERAWLDEIISQYRSHKKRCERAVEQVSDEDLFRPLSGNPASIAVVMKHLGGNHRSRWRDFLTTDGEKADRNRDQEFVVEGETPESIRAIWGEGWRITFDTLESLEPDDLEKTITIRGEPHTVVQALTRNLTHLAYHTGQIVHLARHYAGDDWQTLSVAIGKSEEHNAQMRERWGDWNG
jgi:uncharacterized damage-inducible protein DinB